MIDLGGDVKAHDDLQSLLGSIDEVRPHPNNPRNSDTDVIVESVKENGVYRPIYVQKSTGYIVAGNHTYAALMELGAVRVPIVWLDVDDTQAKRIMLVDNRAADLGEYDDGLLLLLLDEMKVADGGLLGTGFDEVGVDDLRILLDEREHRVLDPSTNTQQTPTMDEYAQRYEEMGRRMLVLDYDKAQYAEVTTRLAALRVRYGLDNNSEAVRRLLAEQPDLVEAAADA